MNMVTCTISFVDGDQLKVEWAKQEDASIRARSIMEKILANENFAIELEGRLVMIPLQNVRTIEVRPAPDKLPETVVRGARIV
jgi:hypothetical protein